MEPTRVRRGTDRESTRVPCVQSQRTCSVAQNQRKSSVTQNQRKSSVTQNQRTSSMTKKQRNRSVTQNQRTVSSQDTEILVYFGVGWDIQPLSKREYKAVRHFIFIDALPKVPHYGPDDAGYPFSKDRKSFVDRITAEAKRRWFYKLREDGGNHLRYESKKGRTVEYHINTTVEEALNHPMLSQQIHEAQLLYIEGFYPTEYGLDLTPRDMPNLTKICVGRHVQIPFATFHRH